MALRYRGKTGERLYRDRFSAVSDPPGLRAGGTGRGRPSSAVGHGVEMLRRSDRSRRSKTSDGLVAVTVQKTCTPQTLLQSKETFYLEPQTMLVRYHET